MKGDSQMMDEIVNLLTWMQECKECGCLYDYHHGCNHTPFLLWAEEKERQRILNSWLVCVNCSISYAFQYYQGKEPYICARCGNPMTITEERVIRK